jgi:hypothetical protein
MSLPEALANQPLGIPWMAAVARRARGIVVHADFCSRYLGTIGCRTPVFVVPHPPGRSAAGARGAEPPGGGSARRPAPARSSSRPATSTRPNSSTALLAAIASLPDDVHVAIVGRTVETYDFAPDRGCRRRSAIGSSRDATSATSRSRVARRRRHRRRPPPSAPRRGLRLARARDAGRAADDRLGDRHVPRQPADGRC